MISYIIILSDVSDLDLDQYYYLLQVKKMLKFKKSNVNHLILRQNQFERLMKHELMKLHLSFLYIEIYVHQYWQN